MFLVWVLVLLVLSLFIGIAIGAYCTKKRCAKEHAAQLEQLREYCGELLRQSFGCWAAEGQESIEGRLKRAAEREETRQCT